jgi:hypothetical protein
VYSLPLDDNLDPTIASAGWLEALAESEAQLAIGQIVRGDEIMQELHEAIARLEARRVAKPDGKTTPRL